MTIVEALAWAKDREERREAEWLLSHILERPRSWLLGNLSQSLDPEENHRYETLLTRRANGEPLAYLLGRWEFWSLELFVNKEVLIPRPETELLVEIALAGIPSRVSWEIADLGTGSGAVALAIAKERPTCHVVATDLSPFAIDVAKRNAQTLDLRNVEFMQGNWCAALPEKHFHCILSNPPYVSEEDCHLEALSFEPRSALVSGKDGLDAIRQVISEAQHYLSLGGEVILEHGHDQGSAVRGLFSKMGYSEVITSRDLEDRERVTRARKF
ncbi:protein-(glutamine-N(5)) methyltransferase [Gammaproteobacteria bacterium]